MATVYRCDVCGFEAKSPQGLATHQRSCKGAPAPPTPTSPNPPAPGKDDQPILQAISGLGTRLDEIDKDFCKKFPDLCQRVEGIEKGMQRPPAYASEEWQDIKRRDLEHTLFDDCPTCSPIRDQVLAGKGKRITDAETPPEKPGGDQTGTINDEEPETSRWPRSGFKWDDDKELYVKQPAK